MHQANEMASKVQLHLFLKGRNAGVFRHVDETNSLLARCCRDDFFSSDLSEAVIPLKETIYFL